MPNGSPPPPGGVRDVVAVRLFMRPEHIEKLVEGLRLAGVPE